MNVIVSNLNKDKFSNLGVDIIKSINGEFDVDEIVQSFSNFFFNRMFLDITAIKDYKNFNNIQKLSMGLDVDKIIILLNDDPVVNSNIYLSKLGDSFFLANSISFSIHVEESIIIFSFMPAFLIFIASSTVETANIFIPLSIKNFENSINPKP